MRSLCLLGALAAALALPACASSEGRSIDFGEGSPDGRRPRDRPYPCPNYEPTAGAQCSTNELSCGYGDGACVCLRDPSGNFGQLVWTCNFGAATQGCPDSEPHTGASCTTLFGAPECEYTARLCHCASEAQTWACWNPSDCPRREPDEAAECQLIGMTCEYSDVRCECFPDGWRCE